MELLGIRPGPVVGRAYRFLLEERMENGPGAPGEAEAKLRQWWEQQPEAAQAQERPEPGSATEGMS